MSLPKRLSDTLPPLPPSLKSVSPYIQRADELSSKDPIMAYWCTYYAAQLGLDQKSHEPGAKDYLFALITLLEKLKSELGQNDAIEQEAAGAAYVENFALKVFALADREDRKGEATRSTAKKFLAAANFLELLRVFEKTNNAQVNEEKVRYAKWKASDIAKAYREGRQPAAGSAGNSPHESAAALSPSGVETPLVRSPSRSPRNSSSTLPTEPKISPRSAALKLKHIPAEIKVPPTDLPSPSTWSTVATPGLDGANHSTTSSKLAFASAMNRWNRPNDDSTMGVSPDYADIARATLPADSSKKVHFSPSVVGGLSSTDGSPPPSPTGQHPPPYSSFSSAAQYRGIVPGPSSNGRVDPSQTPLPDSSPSASSLTSLETSPQGSDKPSRRPRSGSSPTGRMGKTSPQSKRLSLQTSNPSAAYNYSNGNGNGNGGQGRSSTQGGISPQRRSPRVQATGLPSYSPPTSSGYSAVPPPPLPGVYGMPSGGGSGSGSGASPAPIPGLPQMGASGSYTGTKPPSPPSRYVATAISAIANNGVAAAPRAAVAATTSSGAPAGFVVELTPGLVAKAQKHARYAISALEYEDAETARQELRAALALLGE